MGFTLPQGHEGAAGPEGGGSRPAGEESDADQHPPFWDGANHGGCFPQNKRHQEGSLPPAILKGPCRKRMDDGRYGGDHAGSSGLGRQHKREPERLLSTAENSKQVPRMEGLSLRKDVSLHQGARTKTPGMTASGQ